MAEVPNAQYSRSLRKQLADAGLQGALQADAFKLLLQYMAEEQADQQIMAIILEQLKEGESPARLPAKMSGCEQWAGCCSTSVPCWVSKARVTARAASKAS